MTPEFLSTLSLRRATGRHRFFCRALQFLSTLSLRRATVAPPYNLMIHQISIHALLAESDSIDILPKLIFLDFYPRSPCGERPFPAFCMSVRSVFLSTLSLRRATPPSPPKARVLKNFYPRSPCGERQANRCTTIPYFNFYPRSPCGERLLLPVPPAWQPNFYPRSPCGERPNFHDLNLDWIIISIHALLAESD